VAGTIFLDASGWFAALSPRDQWHAPAVRAYTEETRRGATFITTTLVLAEVHALLLRWRDPATGRRFLDAAFGTPSHTIIAPDMELTRAAIDTWIGGFADQAFSVCDAVSFELMRRERIARALAFDQHFAIAGFALVD